MSPTTYRCVLGILGGVFLLRVLAQFVLQFQSIPGIPGFAAWHSATLSYPMLLTIQVAILALMLAAIVWAPIARARPNLGRVLIAAGWLYAGAMAARLVIGAFGLVEHGWFNAAVPTAIHFPIAAFTAVTGSSLKGAWRNGPAPVAPVVFRLVSYPALMAGSYLLFVWLTDTGSTVLFASYLSVLLGGLGVLLHETFSPLREDWRPRARDVANDGLFLALVQIAWPTLVKLAGLAVIVWLAENEAAPFGGIWPHAAPPIAQVGLMLLVAEFFRYWIHRAAHELKPLWKLHAVHHAADRLYTVNVGRFHPLDKFFQFFGDTLPFLLLGVSAEVFAAYFVVYAVNGFYQHSNADVRLGPLNWIIAGPELHRWHHSPVVAEGNRNYGNNLIVWDVIFGTRFLPKGRQVAEVGIANKAWPGGFARQMWAPFTTPTDAG